MQGIFCVEGGEVRQGLWSGRLGLSSDEGGAGEPQSIEPNGNKNNSVKQLGL